MKWDGKEYFEIGDGVCECVKVKESMIRLNLIFGLYIVIYFVVWLFFFFGYINVIVFVIGSCVIWW